MKKQLIKALSLLLVCVCVIGLSTPAAAASTVSSKSYTGSSRGGTSSYIYVKTNSKSATKSVKLTCNKGIIKTTSSTDSMGDLAVKLEVRASYEIKICYWNGSKWVQETSYLMTNISAKMNSIVYAPESLRGFCYFRLCMRKSIPIRHQIQVPDKSFHRMGDSRRFDSPNTSAY